MSRLETGAFYLQPSYDVIMRWAAMLGVTPTELVKGASGDASLSGEPIESVLDRIGAWPEEDDEPTEMDQVVAAGGHDGGIVQGEGTVPHLRRSPRLSRLYLVRIEGDCLEPRASRGDYAVFDPDKPAENGNLVVVADGDQALIKYLAHHEAMQYLLPLDGDPIPLSPSMRIVGVVRYIRRGPGSPPRMKERE